MKDAIVAKKKIAKERVHVIKPDIILPVNNLAYPDEHDKDNSSEVFFYIRPRHFSIKTI